MLRFFCKTASTAVIYFEAPLLNVNLPSEAAPAAYEYSHPFFFNSRFLTALRRGSQCAVARAMSKSNLFKAAPSSEKIIIRIAAHLRRGDVETNKIKGRKRITDDEAYIELFLALFETIGHILPTAEVDAHVFTSCSHSLANSACDKYADILASIYHPFEIKVHVDYENSATATEDAMRTWAHFISADILIVAKSSFSFTPAIFNDGCIIYEPHWSKPLPEWVNVNMTWIGSKSTSVRAELTRQLQRSLPKCLKPAGQKLALWSSQKALGRGQEFALGRVTANPGEGAWL